MTQIYIPNEQEWEILEKLFQKSLNIQNYSVMIIPPQIKDKLLKIGGKLPDKDLIINYETYQFNDESHVFTVVKDEENIFEDYSKDEIFEMLENMELETKLEIVLIAFGLVPSWQQMWSSKQPKLDLIES
jgi:hypothetical protein